MIKAKVPPEDPDANLKSYAQGHDAFSWADIDKQFTWHETGKLNIVHEAIDRWAQDADRRERKALIFEKAGKVREFSYADLSDISTQWANLFIEHGFGVGDRMFIFLPSGPEVFFAFLACARLGIIFSVIFPSTSYDEIDARIRSAKPRGVVTHPDLAERLPRQAMSSVEHVFITGNLKLDFFNSEIVVQNHLKDLPRRRTIKWVSAKTPLFLIYTTSGSAGPPKAVVHCHGAMSGHLMTARYVLNVRDDTVLWTDSGEPGWVTGIVYGALAPWLCGITSVVHGDQFSASTWYRTLEKHQVSVWYTSPRILTRLMEAGDDLPARYDLSSLRHISTVGETLSPDQFYWARQHLKRAPHDSWWMTETGMICVSNFPCMGIKPGSMGKPVPGIEVAVVNDEGEKVPEFTMGELVIRREWPSMMIGLWEDESRYKQYFRSDGWFFSGDMVTMDEEGYLFYDGRNDDLIKVGTKDTGPYEVEQILALHQAVAESVVISVRSPGGKAEFKAFVRVKDGFPPSTRLNIEIKSFVRASFTPEIPLSEVVFMDELPRTRAGLPLRSVLIARELGVPSGDHSTLSE